jgi:hypothetical protein
MVRQNKHCMNVGDCAFVPQPKKPGNTLTVMINKVINQSGKPTVYEVEDTNGNVMRVSENEIRLRM